MSTAHAHAHSHAHESEGVGLNPFIEGWLDRLEDHSPVLDLGCGHGFWTNHMADRGMQVIGIEPDVDRVGEAAAAAKAPVVAGDGALLPFADASLGMVWCIHVLHHLDDPVRVLAEIRRVLRPDGHLVLAETVEDNPVVRVGRRVRPEWDGVPIRSRFTASTLLGLLDEAGFAVVDRRQHSLVSFAAWALPRSGRKAWLWLTGIEDRLPPWTRRWGAHLEVVARRP